MNRAIILVDHGSREAAANQMLEDVATLVRGMTGDRVYTAHMEIAEPTLAGAFTAACRDGSERIFVFPYFLAPGRHSTQDIPRMCEEAAAGLPRPVAYHCAEPLGLDPALAGLVVQRAAACGDASYRAVDVSAAERGG